MIRRPPRSTRTDTLFPYTTLFRSLLMTLAQVRFARIPVRCGPPRPAPEDSRSPRRSEEHTSELQSLMRISYAVFCLKTQKLPHTPTPIIPSFPHLNTQHIFHPITRCNI